MVDRHDQTKALASDVRYAILEWLQSPEDHFAEQESGDPREIGVCVTLITEKAGMAQPTISRHLEILQRAEFVTVERIGRWSYFKRNQQGIDAYKAWLAADL